jgi:hypothetical protein
MDVYTVTNKYNPIKQPLYTFYKFYLIQVAQQTIFIFGYNKSRFGYACYFFVAELCCNKTTAT